MKCNQHLTSNSHQSSIDTTHCVYCDQSFNSAEDFTKHRKSKAHWRKISKSLKGLFEFIDSEEVKDLSAKEITALVDNFICIDTENSGNFNKETNK